LIITSVPFCAMSAHTYCLPKAISVLQQSIDICMSHLRRLQSQYHNKVTWNGIEQNPRVNNPHSRTQIPVVNHLQIQIHAK
jgi:hypothetical protein